ncbi:12471_t:CDS:2, partial [Racocetra persica]
AEFWTNSPNSEEDHDTLKNLYKNRFLNTSSQSLSMAESFWNCFRNSYDANFRGIDEVRKFISPNAINAARKFSHINGPGCIALEKSVVTRSKMPE